MGKDKIHKFKANDRFEKSFQMQKTQMHLPLGDPTGKKLGKRFYLNHLQDKIQKGNKLIKRSLSAQVIRQIQNNNH